MLKVAYFLRKIQTLRVNNSRIPRIKNAKFSEYYFYLNTNIYGDFQICISVPLRAIYNTQTKTYRDLHHINCKIDIHTQNIQTLMTEIYKCLNYDGIYVPNFLLLFIAHSRRRKLDYDVLNWITTS